MCRELEGVRVVSLAVSYPGPLAGMMLSDLGADVVVVEGPHTPDPARMLPAFHEALNRGKRSVALDLKHAGARDAFYALADSADVVLEGFRPGVAARLGVDHQTLRARNPKLVYVSISAYGQDGPLATAPAHDLNLQAESGMLDSVELDADATYIPGPAVEFADIAAGMTAVQGVLLGLLCAERTGLGSFTDVSMFDSLVSTLAGHISPAASGSGPPGVQYETGYGLFATADAKLLGLGIAGEDHFWRSLCDVIGLSEVRGLGASERLSRPEVARDSLAARIATRSRDEWIGLLQGAAVPCSAVRSLGEVASHPQAVHRKLLHEVSDEHGSHLHVRQPLVIDGEAPGPTTRAPRLGEHTEEVLTSCGIAASVVRDLVTAGAAVCTVEEHPAGVLESKLAGGTSA